MSTANNIVIIGATGVQGRTIIKAFLSLPDWHIRGTTRNASSAPAQELTKQGVEMVQADLTDPASLTRAFDGADVIFLNTDFWGPYATALQAGESRDNASKIALETEISHAKNAVQAGAKVPTLRRFVYSALGPMAKASNGKYPHCGHWDSKAAVVDYVENEMPALAKKTQFVYPAGYHTNAFLLPRKYPHFGDEWILLLPGSEHTTIPVIDMDTTFGLLVRALIVDEESGVKLFAYDLNATADNLLDAWHTKTGLKARFVSESMENVQQITGLPPEVLDGPGFLSEFHFMAGVGGKVIEPKDLKNPVNLKTFEQMLEPTKTEELTGSQHNAR